MILARKIFPELFLGGVEGGKCPTSPGATEESNVERIIGRTGIRGPFDQTGKEAGPTEAYGISDLGSTAG